MADTPQLTNEQTPSNDGWKEFQAHLLKAGESYRLFYGKGHRRNKLIHIRAIVDDEVAVYRYWYAFEWVYVIESAAFFYVNREHLTKAESK